MTFSWQSPTNGLHASINISITVFSEFLSKIQPDSKVFDKFRKTNFFAYVAYVHALFPC